MASGAANLENSGDGLAQSRTVATRCPKCAYDLASQLAARGGPPVICPECGQECTAPVGAVRVGPAMFWGMVMACMPVMGLCLLCLVLLVMNWFEEMLALLAIATVGSGFLFPLIAPVWTADRHKPRIPLYWLILMFGIGLMVNFFVGVSFLMIAALVASGPSIPPGW